MKIADSFLEPEVRNGFYVPSCVKQAWAAELKVLQEIDRICKKYNIPYFADWGTLLGAVRHGGFIPWDDDLDIVMKRKDYEYFLQVAKKEMPEGFCVFTYETHPDFWSFLARFVSKNRICFEADHLKAFYGFPYIVGIDIFVLDYVSEDAEKNSERNKVAKYVIEAIDLVAEGKITGREADTVLDKIERMLHVTLLNRRDLHKMRVQVYKEAEKLFGAFSEEESKEFTRMMPDELYNENAFRLQKEYYDQQVWLPFENTYLPVPSGYDEMLRRRYGDYMKLVRNCGGHNYPFFETQKKSLQAVLDFEMPGYRYNGIAERKREVYEGKSLKAIVTEAYQYLFDRSQFIVKQEMQDIEVLRECQQLAIDMGTLIEQCKGEGHPVVEVLELYCEVLFGLSQSNAVELKEKLSEVLLRLEERIEKDILNRTETVFVTYKADQWKYIRSVWQAAMEDETCDVYVIAVPYYYKEWDGTFRDMQYEGDLFPENVQITRYDEFDFELHQPEKIFIQNPYDEHNPVMSVHSFFYSANLKNYTEKLVYIPPFVLEEFSRESYREYHNMQYYCTMPGVVNADVVVVQSENMKQLYVEKLTEFAGEETREIWEGKIRGIGSPVEDVECVSSDTLKELRTEWSSYLQKADGSSKKVVLFYIGVSSFIQYKEKALDKINDVFRIFEENKEDVVMLWKPQTIIKDTLKQLEPELYKEYVLLEQKFNEQKLGIYCDLLEDNWAAEFCDAYYGDASPLAQLCRDKGKPVMLADVTIC